MNFKDNRKWQRQRERERESAVGKEKKGKR